MNQRSSRSHCITEINITIPAAYIKKNKAIIPPAAAVVLPSSNPNAPIINPNHTPQIRDTFSVGDKVEVMYAGRDKYYPGKIDAVYEATNTYDIFYDDGEREFTVDKKLIRLIASNSPIEVNNDDDDSSSTKQQQQQQQQQQDPALENNDENNNDIDNDIPNDYIIMGRMSLVDLEGKHTFKNNLLQFFFFFLLYILSRCNFYFLSLSRE